jgi:hypothetical protein
MLTLQQAVEQLPLLKKSQTAAYQVNLACERLVAMGKFKGWVLPLNLHVYEKGTVTLPGDFETMLGATLNGSAQEIKDPWYEFAPRPNREYKPDPEFYPADLGDKHVTYRSPAGAAELRVVAADSGDQNAEITVKVRESNDQGVRAETSEWSGTVATATGLFDTVPIDEVIGFSKPRTSGHLTLSAMLNGLWVEVGRFQPRDTEISFRKYSIPAAQEGDTVVAYCKKRFRPVEELSDELPVESIYALRLALEALLSETEGDIEKASNFWMLSRKALSDALSEFRSSAVRTVPIYCRAAAGSKLRAIR